jgi:hypothetical protein
MRPLHIAVAILLFAGPGLLADEPDVTGSRETKPGQAACHGTAVEFVNTPVEAAKLAREQKKLVFVLHVSGHFEDPDFT